MAGAPRTIKKSHNPCTTWNHRPSLWTSMRRQRWGNKRSTKCRPAARWRRPGCRTNYRSHPAFHLLSISRRPFRALTFSLDGSLAFSLPALSTLHLNSQTEQEGVLQHAPPDSLPGLVQRAARLHMLQVLRAGWHTRFSCCVSCDRSIMTRSCITRPGRRDTSERRRFCCVLVRHPSYASQVPHTLTGNAAACTGAQLRGHGQCAAGAGVQHTAAVRGRLRG